MIEQAVNSTVLFLIGTIIGIVFLVSVAMWIDKYILKKIA